MTEPEAPQPTRLRLYSAAGLMRHDMGETVDFRMFNAAYLARSEAEAMGLLVQEMQSRCPNHAVCKSIVAAIPDEVVKKAASA